MQKINKKISYVVCIFDFQFKLFTFLPICHRKLVLIYNIKCCFHFTTSKPFQFIFMQSSYSLPQLNPASMSFAIFYENVQKGRVARGVSYFWSTVVL